MGKKSCFREDYDWRKKNILMCGWYHSRFGQWKHAIHFGQESHWNKPWKILHIASVEEEVLTQTKIYVFVHTSYLFENCWCVLYFVLYAMFQKYINYYRIKMFITELNYKALILSTIITQKQSVDMEYSKKFNPT